MDRIYYRFPMEVDFERNYGYNADMRYLVKAIASLHGKSGSVSFETEGPNIKRHVDVVRARRDVLVEITDKKIDFIPLTVDNLSRVLSSIPQSGTIDYRITVRYSYVDNRNFDKMPLKSDVFLVRTTLNGDLNIRVVNIDGQGRTLPEEIANTIETQLKYYKE